MTVSRTRWLFLLALTAPQAARAAAPPDPSWDRAGPKALLGSWQQDEKGKVNLLHFEPGRLISFRHGELSFRRVRYQGDRIFTIDLGGRARPLANFELAGDRLLLTDSVRKRVPFRRLKNTPPELALAPLPLGERKELTRERARTIEKELLRREKANIRVRFEYRALKKPKEKKAKLAEMYRIDADDTRYLRALVKEVGWIDGRRFSGAAVDAAYLIAMHTRDYSLMEGAARELEKEVKAKRFDAERFAGLFDRYRLVTGQRERYGMHVAVGPRGKLVVGPLEDRVKVDALRKAIGLPPLARYLERYREENGGEPVQVLDE
jgi:hypothetical protein